MGVPLSLPYQLFNIPWSGKELGTPWMNPIFKLATRKRVFLRCHLLTIIKRKHIIHRLNVKRDHLKMGNIPLILVVHWILCFCPNIFRALTFLCFPSVSVCVHTTGSAAAELARVQKNNKGKNTIFNEHPVDAH